MKQCLLVNKCISPYTQSHLIPQTYEHGCAINLIDEERRLTEVEKPEFT